MHSDDPLRRWAPVLLTLAFLGVLGAIAVPIVMPIITKEPEARKLLWERFSHLELGATKEETLAALGPPGYVCLGTDGIYRHQYRSETSPWDDLIPATAERWVYPQPFDEVKTGVRSMKTKRVPPGESCGPRYAEGEVGFDRKGRVLWLIPLTDESYVSVR